MARAALSLRAIERDYGVSRRRAAEAIRLGELRAAVLGVRRYTVLRSDIEAWLCRHAVRRDGHAERVVEARLAREARSSSTP